MEKDIGKQVGFWFIPCLIFPPLWVMIPFLIIGILCQEIKAGHFYKESFRQDSDKTLFDIAKKLNKR